jgi:hypothetical protein
VSQTNVLHLKVSRDLLFWLFSALVGLSFGICMFTSLLRRDEIRQTLSYWNLDKREEGIEGVQIQAESIFALRNVNHDEASLSIISPIACLRRQGVPCLVYKNTERLFPLSIVADEIADMAIPFELVTTKRRIPLIWKISKCDPFLSESVELPDEQTPFAPAPPATDHSPTLDAERTSETASTHACASENPGV